MEEAFNHLQKTADTITNRMVISMEGYCVQYKAVLRVEQAAPRSTLPPSTSFSTRWLMRMALAMTLEDRKRRGNSQS